MFFQIKKRPFLQDLIPGDYTDIHSHLLPGIDDGAKNIEDTITLQSELSQMGFARFITTPHVMKSVWENTRSGIETNLISTQSKLQERGVNVEINAAAEYLLDNNFVELFNTEPLLTIGGSHVLVEMSYLNPPIQLYQIIFELQVAGYKPILAHPERYLFYHHNFGEYAKLRHAGCAFQINMLSLVGYYGIGVAETAKKLLEKGFIDFCGSDVHHEGHVSAFSRRILIKDTTPFKEAMQRNSLFKF